jgi:hypothetical protein
LPIDPLPTDPSLPGLPDPTTLLPTISPVVAGAGMITAPISGLVCDNSSATSQVPVPCSDPLTATELTGLTSVLLTAVPATGWQFDGWTGCPVPSGTVCGVTSSVLDPLTPSLTPVAAFVPLPTGTDKVAPRTVLTSDPGFTGNKTTAVVAAFGFRAVEADGKDTAGATFECQLSGPGQELAYQACTSPKAYTGLTPGSYVFSVQAIDRAGNRDTQGATYAWTVESAPNTTLRGPVGWLLRNDASYTVGASGTATGYSCRYDGTAKACSAGSPVVLKGIKAGTHTLTATAADAAGHRDATPATATFTVPRNDTVLAHSAGWTKRRGLGHFLNTFSSTTKRGATLSTKAAGIKRVGLVVGKGRGYGTVKVYLGTKLLKKVPLAATGTRSCTMVPVATFRSARRGTIKVVVVTAGKKVVIEGLGIASR